MIDYNNKPLSYRIHEIHKLFMNNVKSECNKIGINTTYKYIFMALKNNMNGLSQSEICSVVYLKAPSISLLLSQMENDNLIIRTKSKNDSRKIIVQLTEKGLELDKKMMEIFKKNEKVLYDSLNEQELDSLNKILHKLSSSLIGGDNNV